MRGRRTLPCSLAAIAMLQLGGCGGSSTTTAQGNGPAGIAAARVCLDLDDSATCEAAEPATDTGAQGEYSLVVKKADLDAHRLLWVGDAAVVTATGAPLSPRYVLASVPGSPREISVFSTILSSQTAVGEAALKSNLGISESASLLGGYAANGEIAGYVAALTPLYADLYAAVAADSALAPAEKIADAVSALLADTASVSSFVADLRATTPLTPSNAATTSTQVGEEIFQSIPIDAATMSFGIGMDEMTRKVVSGAYCLSGLQSALAPQLSLCQNTRTYFFRLIKSEKDLRDLLNVGGGIDLGTTVVSGSLEGRFVDEMRKDTSAIYAVIKTEYVLCGYKIFDVSLADTYLTADATHASYTNNYAAFRAACGDRYLDTIATGGAYYGMLKIQTDSLAHKRDLTVKLEGKYGKAGISVSVRGDLQSSVAEAVKDENVTILVGSRGVSPEFLGLPNGNGQLIDSLEDFFNAADQFLDAISSPTNECHDDTVAFQKCAYTASFADYATVAHATVRNATEVKNLAFTKKLMGQYEDYTALQSNVGDVVTHSADYDWEGHTLAKVYSLLAYMKRGKLIMDAAFTKCLTDFVGCTDNAAASSLLTFNEIVSELPFETWKAPQDCLDVQRLIGKTDTDAATVFVRGDLTKQYQVSCRRMDTSEPETYLDLVNTSALSTPTYNSSVAVNADDSETASVYQRLRVNVNLDNLEVVYDQGDSASTTAGAAAPVRLGSAKDCNATTGRAKANIDLAGTHFSLDPIVSFAPSVAPESTYEWVTTAKTFDEAKAYAETRGGRLVEIDDLIEFATLRADVLANHPGTNSWIGMRRLDTAATPGWKQFKWIYKNTTITTADYQSYFHSGEPNNAGGNEACVHFWSDGLLNDLNCATLLPFYIEYTHTNPTGAATFNADRTAVDVSVSGAEAGTCAEIKATTPIRLKYNG